MGFRIAAAQISHETNVFSAVPTGMAAFLRSGLTTDPSVIARDRGTNSAFGGFLAGADEQGFDLIPLASVWATPSGMVTRAAFDQLTRSVIDGIRAARPIDGVLLALHGAMVSQDEPDADGALLDRVRAEVGPSIPIVATLDLHANISARMVAAADLLIGYETYPHVDMADRAREAAAMLHRILLGEIKPVAVLKKPPMLPTSQRMTTDRNPMAELMSRARIAQSDARVLNVTVAGGFPPADVEEAGFSALVTTNDDRELAERIASDIALEAWNRRQDFLGGVSSFDEAADAIQALPAGAKPIVLVDIGDNPWTGGPGDSAELVRFLLDQHVANAAVALVADPESVARCMAAGVGSITDLTLGGKTDRLHGESLRASARVKRISDGVYVNAGPMMAGLTVDLGSSVIVEIGPHALRVLVTSRAETPIDRNVFIRHGIDPTKLRVIGLKGKGHFRAAFEPIASAVVLVEGPGITGADLARLPFRRVRRPIWPLDPETQWNEATIQPPSA
jgi:microcystin degradation protein MlrC